jgi:hypothetical protein
MKLARAADGMNTAASVATKAQPAFDNEIITVSQAFQSFFSPYHAVMRKGWNEVNGSARQQGGLSVAWSSRRWTSVAGL